jgi:hypothetical protein
LPPIHVDHHDLLSGRWVGWDSSQWRLRPDPARSTHTWVISPPLARRGGSRTGEEEAHWIWKASAPPLGVRRSATAVLGKELLLPTQEEGRRGGFGQR